jgi:hypothetical protein
MWGVFAFARSADHHQYVWVAAVDAFEAADRMRAGTVEGGFILRDECISRIIKFDSKQKTIIINTRTYDHPPLFTIHF